jgi:hypothetical protein
MKEMNSKQATGSQCPPKATLHPFPILQKAPEGESSNLPPLMAPKGVYRFKTHEEADAWAQKYRR